MTTFVNALDNVGPASWTTHAGNIRVALLRSTGDAPTLTETTMAALWSGGCVEITDTDYARGVLDNLAVVATGPDRVLDADSYVWTAVGTVGSGQTVMGAVIYLHVTDDSDSVPLFHQAEFVGTLNGTDAIMQIGTGGVYLFDADPT